MGQGEIMHLKDEDIQSMTREPLWWQKQGLQYTASGYGKKIPSEWVAEVGGKRYRVYVRQFGNAGSAYIIRGGEEVYFWDTQVVEKRLKLPEAERRYAEHLRTTDPGHFGKIDVPQFGHLRGDVGRLYKAHARREKRRASRKPRLTR